MSGGNLPGRGGVSRGRADAELGFLGETEDAAAAKPERLPPGARRPAPSIRIGTGRAEPSTDPVVDGGPGTAGDDGVGAAAWRRRIAPRHRDAVRAFFGSAEAPPLPPSLPSDGK
jgi:hypothetical protein